MPQRLFWGQQPPPIGTAIDWDGQVPTTLRYAVVFGPDSGSNRKDPVTTGMMGPQPMESVRGVTISSSNPAPMAHPDGHLWGGTPTSQASATWTLSFAGDNWESNTSEDRITILVRQWAMTTYGLNNGGRVVWNGSVGVTDRLEAYTPLNPTGYGYWRMGNGTPGQGTVEFTEPELLTGFRSLMFSASTGVGGRNAGMRVIMDGSRVIASQDTWSGTKWDVTALQVGAGFWGVISYVYVFDDYITDIGFAQMFHERPYWIFAEPRVGRGTVVASRRRRASAWVDQIMVAA